MRVAMLAPISWRVPLYEKYNGTRLSDDRTLVIIKAL
jgi:hypothetical protein